MANAFSRDILIQAPDPKMAAAFYVEHLGFTVTSGKPMIELRAHTSISGSPCPKPYHLWVNSKGRVNCFQQQLSYPRGLSSPKYGAVLAIWTSDRLCASYQVVLSEAM